MEEDEREGGGEEVVLSIEETNKLRIKLGLKPLNVEDTKKKTDNEKEKEKTKEEIEKNKKTMEIAGALAK